MMDTRVALKLIQKYYDSMLSCSSSSGRKYNGEKILEIMWQVPETKDYWYYHPEAQLWQNRFGKYELPAPLANEVRIERGVVYDPIINGYTAPQEEGLYFVGEVFANPHTEAIQYWVKIGKGQDLSYRLDNYNTYCPCTYRIDTIVCDAKRETMYRHWLAAHALGRHETSREWYMVDRETYIAMSEEGFNYFNKIR